MTLADRIQSYLLNGGLFNPEMMDPEKVGALLLDLREYVKPRPEYSAPVNLRVLALVGGQWRVGVRAGTAPGHRSIWYDDDAGYEFEFFPTHWLPLPPAP